MRFRLIFDQKLQRLKKQFSQNFFGPTSYIETFWGIYMMKKHFWAKKKFQHFFLGKKSQKNRKKRRFLTFFDAFWTLFRPKMTTSTRIWGYADKKVSIPFFLSDQMNKIPRRSGPNSHQYEHSRPKCTKSDSRTEKCSYTNHQKSIFLCHGSQYVKKKKHFQKKKIF